MVSDLCFISMKFHRIFLSMQNKKGRQERKKVTDREIEFFEYRLNNSSLIEKMDNMRY
jgi:hypothetical protein